MAITLDAATVCVDTGPESFFSFTHTTAALAKGYALVCIWLNTKTFTISNVTFGGSACARIGSAAEGVNAKVEVWGLKNPPNNGSKTVAGTFSNSDYFRVAAVTFDGVDQTTPVSGETTVIDDDGGGTTESFSVPVTSATGDIAIATVGVASGRVVTLDQTRLYPVVSTNYPLHGEYMNGSSSPVTLTGTWTGHVAYFAHGFSLKADAPIVGYMWL